MKGAGFRVLLFGAGIVAIAAPLAAGGELDEEEVEFEGITFRVVKVAPQRLQVVWKGDDGKPLQSFDKVQAHFEARGKKVTFLANAGIYEPGWIPSGLHIEAGRELNPLNLKDGKGNFYLKPNGVFSVIKGGRASVVRSREFVNQGRGLPRIAVQSGPLLLANGVIHPAFNRGSPNLKHRNGVGVDRENRVVFAVTGGNQETNFHTFARFFLSLGCKDALFLDGDISQMAVNPKGRVESNLFGAMFVVAE